MVSPAKRSVNTISADRRFLIEIARGGCDQTLGALLESYRPYFLKIAEDTMDSGLRPKLSPSDLVQGSLVIAAEKFHQFRGETDDELLNWLRTIFRNQLTDGVRRYRVAQKRATGREACDSSVSIEKEMASPSESIAAHEEVDRLLAGIERLPPLAREVVRMRYLEDLSFAQIADRLDCSPDMSRRVWLKAIDDLGRELGN